MTSRRWVTSGAFRHDLYYRIHVVPLALPPLRRRREDIPLLVEHFIARFNRIQGRNVEGVTPEVMELLMAHDYPGNVRELQNLIEHAFVLCREGRLSPKHLPEPFRGTPARPPPPAADLEAAVRMTEAQTLREALAQNGFNRAATARALGLHKSTLFRKVRSLGIELPPEDGRSRKRP